MYAFAPVVILRLRNMTAIDATGLHAIEALHAKIVSSGRIMLICGARSQPAKLIRHSNFFQHIGEKNVLPHISAALERAHELNEAAEAGPNPPEPLCS